MEVVYGCRFMDVQLSLMWVVYGCRLLDVLAGRKNPHGLSGDLRVDGREQPENFKCMAGYVVQVRTPMYNMLRGTCED